MDVRLRAELMKVYMRRMIGNLMDDSVKGTATLCKEHVGLQLGRTTWPASPSHV